MSNYFLRSQTIWNRLLASKAIKRLTVRYCWFMIQGLKSLKPFWIVWRLNIIISAKKAAKKDNFEHAAGHLVLAIGGDLNKYNSQRKFYSNVKCCIPSPKCGDPTDNSTEALKMKVDFSKKTILCLFAIHLNDYVY